MTEDYENLDGALMLALGVELLASPGAPPAYAWAKGCAAAMVEQMWDRLDPEQQSARLTEHHDCERARRLRAILLAVAPYSTDDKS